MRKLINTFTLKIIRKVKREPDYSLDSQIDGLDVLQILFRRMILVMRGSFFKIFLKKSKGFLFLGSHVSIKHPQYMEIGRGVTIEDHVLIDSLSVNGIQLGDNVKVARLSTIECTGVIKNLGVGLSIGNNSAIGAYSYLGAQGGIRIGENVIMGPRVNFHSENHNYSDLTIPIRLQGESRIGITVEDNCWIGAGCILLDGAYVEQGSIIASGSVVNKRFPAYSVLGGVPARILKQRA